ncbi:hypothetical protein Metbo_0052 [Methanobacterium lacus]|jgi:hypothetical protein|uniref:Uncharacterized protein n=1 Tax=Methanobacterium lacus (strain AL-21) TaxID=877455 RepID=F0T6S2_METLA|nr:hypothetical protein [Methanobacterium lacus]ADZ08305.1 hypothetical protein Metbo_0052 [Methanobacterium lacus]
MYSNKISRTDVLNKMGHVFERYRFLTRSKSFKQEQIQTIDYHLTEIMKVLNDS